MFAELLVSGVSLCSVSSWLETHYDTCTFITVTRCALTEMTSACAMVFAFTYDLNKNYASQLRRLLLGMEQAHCQNALFKDSIMPLHFVSGFSTGVMYLHKFMCVWYIMWMFVLRMCL